jgi:hypothetical protein
MVIWYILWPFGNVMVNWYIFPRFGKLCQEKSGNPVRNVKNCFKPGGCENIANSFLSPHFCHGVYVHNFFGEKKEPKDLRYFRNYQETSYSKPNPN